MAITVTDLAVEVKESNQRFTTAIEHLNVEVAKINVYLSFVRVATWVAVPVVISMILGAASATYKIVWDTAQVHMKLEQFDQRFDKLDQRLDRIDQQLGQLVQRKTN